MSDPASCPYTALGLTKDATAAEIKKAYRKLALEFHPDKVQGEQAKEAASKKFQKVNEAYGVLSDEEKRQEYDDKVKLMELRKRSKGEANISVPRTPTATHYNVHYAEPRPDTYTRTKSSSRAPTSSSSTKFYSQYPPTSSRSYEEDIYATRYHDDASRSARRTQSYDERPSKRDDELRERELRRRRAEDREEKERMIKIAEKKEKERLRAEKELKQKKQRKKDSEEKRSTRDAYAVYDDEDLVRSSSKSDKKKSSSSSSRKHEAREVVRELVSPPPMDKSKTHLMQAAEYITKSRSKVSNPPPLSRSNTAYEELTHRYAQHPPVAAPTPPVPQEAPFAPPTSHPISVEEASDEDLPRRSSAKASARRSSDTPRARDRSSHKKSSSGPKEYVVDVPPIPIDPRHVPAFAKAGSTPPRVPDSPPRHSKLSRAQTMKEDLGRGAPPPPPPHPSISRSSTYHYSGEYEPREPRGRDRSRFQAQVVDEEEDSEDERRIYEASRRAAERRHRTRSPEVVPMPAEYPPSRGGGSAYKYHVKDGRAVPAPVEAYYYGEDASPPSRKSKYSSYYVPQVQTKEVRPSMPPRGDSAYSSSGSYMPSKIKTAQSYGVNDVQYSYPQPAGW